MNTRQTPRDAARISDVPSSSVVYLFTAGQLEVLTKLLFADLEAQFRDQLAVFLSRLRSKGFAVDPADSDLTRFCSKSEPPEQKRDYTLLQAGELYLAYMRERVKAGDITEAYRMRARTTLNYITGLHLSLGELDTSGLERIRLHLLSLKHADASQKSNVSHVRQFLRYCQDHGMWVPPAEWSRHLRMKRTHSADAFAQPTDHYTVEELTSLWQNANKTMRLFLILSLNTASEQMAIASFTRAMIQGQCERLVGQRHKTKAPFSYILWPETAKRLQQHVDVMADKSEDALLFRNKQGLPLVRYGASRKDSLYPRWTKLCRASGVMNRGFKYLRKTIARWVYEVSDRDTADLMLAHTSLDLTRKHYTGDLLHRLDDALMQVWDEKVKLILK